MRELLGDLPKITYTPDPNNPLISVNGTHSAVLSAFTIFVLLKAFANGGASLTGLEAISNGVSAFKRPEGLNARRTLSIMSLILGSLALILFTGANTPFTGFPFLASFIAEDSFLPRQMTRRGHRLAFSNGIIVLTAFALALILGVGAHVD
jgi:hypothetical protein